MKNVIVTGGTGVTGNALVHRLLQYNISVTALVRPNSFRRKYLPINEPLLQIVECGMNDYKHIADKINNKNYDAFFHLSWDGSTGTAKVDNRNNYSLQLKNVEYALDAAELCSKLECSVFLMTGSQAQYGRKNHPVKETDIRCPENGYGMAKQCAEGMTRLFCKEKRIKHIWPILFSVYGPNDATESLIDKSVRGILKGETIPYTKGIQLWDYIYSYDAADALILLAKKGRDGQVYNVSYGEQRPLFQYIYELYDELYPGVKPRLGEIDYSENAVMFLGADTTKLREETGFSPSFSFREGIRIIADKVLKESQTEE